MVVVSTESHSDAVEAGWRALSDGDWQGAHRWFEGSLLAGETPEALEGLGFAGYFLDDEPGTFDARERAYRLYRERGDDASAARMAAWLAADYIEFRGEGAVASGWFQRAHRLLDQLEPGPDHGWLAAHEASFMLADRPFEARRLGAMAADMGRRFDVPELEMVGLALEGQGMVLDGEIDEGMRRLDEASVLALEGGARLLACVGWACCYLISACEQVRDYERAGQWSLRMTDFCERHGIGVLLGQCRAKYAGVLTWQGRWDEAEAELAVAAHGLETSRPALTSQALVRLAELRRRQGRFDEAEELLERCEGHNRAPLERAALALDRGLPEDAADLADRFLRRLAEQHLERCDGLELLVRAHVQLGRLDDARTALEQLRELAERTGTVPLRAALLAAEGTVATGSGDHATARRRYEDALDLLAGMTAPFEVARIRIDLARSLDALGRRPAARHELGAALAALRDLGAAGEVARAEDLLAQWGPVGPGPEQDATIHGPLAELTPREREVLGLVAEGLTNGQIAERLVLSDHTVHRHVGNILRKLRLSSRAAAAALATREGLAR